MAAAITLITPPDFYQNNQASLMFIDLTEKEQDDVTAWLKAQDEISLNIYYYQGEPNIPWLLHALAASNYVYVNVDNMSAVASYLIGYIVSKPNVHYSTINTSVSEVFNFINHNRIKDATEFLEGIFNGKG